MVDSNEKKLIKWTEEKNIKAQMVNDDIFQRSHRLHRWVPLVFAQKIFLSNETQCIAYKEKESCFHFVYQWSLCLKCSLPFRCRSFVLLVFFVHFYSSSKCNAKPCGVMHLKSAKMTIFRLEAIFPLILHTVGRQKTAPNRNQKSFFLPNAHTHAGRFWNIHAKPTECHIIRCCFSSFIYFAAILHRNERENEAEIK